MDTRLLPTAASTRAGRAAPAPPRSDRLSTPRGPCSLPVLREAWTQGVIDEHTLVWGQVRTDGSRHQAARQQLLQALAEAAAAAGAGQAHARRPGSRSTAAALPSATTRRQQPAGRRAFSMPLHPSLSLACHHAPLHSLRACHLASVRLPQGLADWLPIRNVRTLVPQIRTVEGERRRRRLAAWGALPLLGERSGGCCSEGGGAQRGPRWCRGSAPRSVSAAGQQHGTCWMVAVAEHAHCRQASAARARALACRVGRSDLLAAARPAPPPSALPSTARPPPQCK